MRCVVSPAKSTSKKFNRLLELVVVKDANWSLPICVQKPFWAFGIVNRDPCRRSEPRAQHVSRLGEEGIPALDEKPHDLPLRDHDANVIEHRDCAFPSHAALASTSPYR